MAKGKKTGGRQQGSTNKRTQQWENFSTYCLTGGLKKFEEELEKLHGKDYINAFTNLLEFHAPKLARSEVKLTGEVTTKNVMLLKNGKEIVI